MGLDSLDVPEPRGLLAAGALDVPEARGLKSAPVSEQLDRPASLPGPFEPEADPETPSSGWEDATELPTPSLSEENLDPPTDLGHLENTGIFNVSEFKDILDSMNAQEGAAEDTPSEPSTAETPQPVELDETGPLPPAPEPPAEAVAPVEPPAETVDEPEEDTFLPPPAVLPAVSPKIANAMEELYDDIAPEEQPRSSSALPLLIAAIAVLVVGGGGLYATGVFDAPQPMPEVETPPPVVEPTSIEPPQPVVEPEVELLPEENPVEDTATPAEMAGDVSEEGPEEVSAEQEEVVADAGETPAQPEQPPTPQSNVVEPASPPPTQPVTTVPDPPPATEEDSTPWSAPPPATAANVDGDGEAIGTPWGAAEPEVADQSMLTVTVNPPNATIFLNDRRFGRSGRRKSVAFGSYTIRVEMNGYETQTKTVDVRVPEMNIPFELQPVVTEGTVQFVGLTAGELYVNGQSRGPLPATITLMPGRHTIKVVQPDGSSFEVLRDIAFDGSGAPEIVNLAQ